MEEPLVRKIPLMDTEHLHRLADQWNWDDGLTVLRLIIDNQQCAIGTALLIYWRGSPHYFRKYTHRNQIEHYNLGNYDLLLEIEKRMEAGFFQHRGIAYDPHNDRGIDLTRCKYKASLMKRDIPAFLLIATTERGIETFELTKGRF